MERNNGTDEPSVVLACPTHEPILRRVMAKDVEITSASAAALMEISECPECQLRILHASSGRSSCTTASNIALPVDGEEEVRFGPIYLPASPGCKIPVEMLANKSFGNVHFGGVLYRDFTDLPAPSIKGNTVPLVVTTPLRALMEYETTGDWSVALPLAPQRTRVVTWRNSPIYGLHDYELAAHLGGRCIAVADVASAYAARLASAARRYGFDVKVTSSIPRKRSPKTLHLVTPGLDRILDLFLKKRLDGFATVEPYPTLARFRLGDAYAELSLDRTCTSVSTGFCCVVAVPTAIVEERRYRHAYQTLTREVVRGLCQLLRPNAFEVIRPLLARTIEPLMNRIKCGARPQTVEAEAAARIVAHLTEHLPQSAGDDDAQRERLLELLVPVIAQEALNAEFEALATYFDSSVKHKLRAAASSRSPLNELYPVSVVRDVCRSVIQAEFPESVTAKIENTRQAASAEIEKTREEARQTPPVTISMDGFKKGRRAS